MNRKWWKLIYMLPITFCTLYAGGYVAQFIRNYQTWESAGNFAGNGTAPQIPSPHPLACLDALTAFPYNLYGIFLCLAAFGLLTFLLMRMGFDRNGGNNRPEPEPELFHKGNLWDFRFYDFGGNASGTGAYE